MKIQTKNLQLTVYIEQDEDGVFIGSVPFLSGCHAQGDTQEKMLENLSEVITLCLRNDDIKEIQKHRFEGIGRGEIDIVVGSIAEIFGICSGYSY